MTVRGETLQASTQTEELCRLLGLVDAIILTTADIDGDSLGALVGLHDLIVRLGFGSNLSVVLEEAVPNRYEFLLANSFTPKVATGAEDWSNAFAIVVDSEPSRFHTLSGAFDSAKYRGLIDHHKTTATIGYDFTLHDPLSPSTTVLVYQLYQSAQIKPSQASARGLYAGLVFDTSIFRYKLTSPESLRMAADLMGLDIDHADIVERLLLVQPIDRVKLRAKVLSAMQCKFDGHVCVSALSYDDVLEVDSGGLVDDLIFIDGVYVAALVHELKDGRSRVSLRSRCSVDVAEIARRLHESGGGHQRSAGVTLAMNLHEAITALDEILSESFTH